MIVWSKESQGGVRQLVGVPIEGKAEELPGTAAFSRERKGKDMNEGKRNLPIVQNSQFKNLG